MLNEKIILIIDSNGLYASDYQKALEQNAFESASIQIITTDNMENAREIIEKYEPDLILAYDNFDEDTNNDITEICAEIRNRKSLIRPVLVDLSDEQHLDKKIEVINAGADDFQCMNTNNEEISLRIYAHLRRQEEESLDSMTKIPAAGTAYKIIKRNIESESKEAMAAMSIDIDNFSYYKDIYGYIAAEKLVQTFIAIVKASINEDDLLAQVNENSFIILTTPEKSEKTTQLMSHY